MRSFKDLPLSIAFLLWTALWGARDLQGQQTQDLRENYPIVSPSYNVPGSTEERFPHLNFRYGWTTQAPYQMAVQFSNPTYGDQKIKFAIKDLTTDQFVLLDLSHNAYFINETLHPSADGAVWSGEVNSLSDVFALKVWDGNGDSYQQDPVTILAEWAQGPHALKASKSFTPAPTAPMSPAGKTTAAPSLNMTPTGTPTAACTPTPCQTPAPYFKCVMAFLGDSYTGGGGSDVYPKSFKSLTIETAKKWYPGLETTADDVIIWEGCDPGCWAEYIGGLLDQIIQKNKDVPIGYLVFETGDNCFFYGPNPGHDGCKGASVSQGVSISYIYKGFMDKAIGTIYAKCPGVHLIVLGMADTSGGAGHYAPPEVYQAYNQRLFELKTKYPRMRIADIYKAIGDQSEYFYHNATVNNDHPTYEGHAIYAKCILDQLSYWPYKPRKHPGKKGNAP